jgi:hypothetical protein
LPWSRIFHQEVTLALPFTFAEATGGAADEMIGRAVTAHMLGIIAAFGADRIDDGQLVATSTTMAVLERVRAARDAAIRSFGLSIASPLYDYRAADLATADANRAEKEYLGAHSATDFITYERLAIGKQYLVFPATMNFARACGMDAQALEQVAAMCLAMAMGLQLRDDATDWEDDQKDDRSWVVRLLRGAAGAEADGHDSPSLKERVADQGILISLLARAVSHFEHAAHLAGSLRAYRIASWGKRQAQLTNELLTNERREPGYTVRWELTRKAARG